MNGAIKAVIFDMDGILIDSEPLWRKAMIKEFRAIGIPFTETDCRKTTGLRIKEVIEYWFLHYKIRHLKVKNIENKIIQRLIELIRKNGKAILGVIKLIHFLKKSNLKIGLATSSSSQLMEEVLVKLKLSNQFDVAISAENMKYGKPHPNVFLTCAKKLKINPKNCLVIEDSINGLISAKAAFMIAIAVPETNYFYNKKYAIADYKLRDMNEVLALLKTLLN